MNWLSRKQAELQQFDLGALNLLGWLLFLSAFGVFFAGVFVAVDVGAAGANDSRGVKKVVGIVVALLGVAWFQLGKAVLGLVGLSVYRASRRES